MSQKNTLKTQEFRNPGFQVSRGNSLLILAIAAAFIFFITHCTDTNIGNDNLKIAGNSSGVGNGMVVGKLFSPDGKNPSQGAIVTVWRKNSLAAIGDTASSGAIKTTATDMRGGFSIDTLDDTGMYLIQGIDNEENMVLIDSIHIGKRDTTVSLPPDTLKAPGAIKGSVVLPLGGNFMQVFVLAFGNDRYVQVKENGTFLFKQLAEATYTLKILSVSSQYGLIDTGNVRVTSAETTDIGAVELPLRQLPKIHLRTAYDSMAQVVTLSWNPAPAGITMGYNVYRRGIGGFFATPLNDSMFVTDTVYADSSPVQDSTYSYGVAMVDKNGKEGPMSVQTTVQAGSGLTVKGSVKLALGAGRLATAMKRLAAGGYVAHVTEEGRNATFIEYYSEDGTRTKTVKLTFADYGDYFGGMDIDSQNNVYFASGYYGSPVLYRLNGSGTIQKLLRDTTPCFRGRFDVSGNSLIFPAAVNDSTFAIMSVTLKTGSVSTWKILTSRDMYPDLILSAAQTNYIL
jgi:hypothetical protein